MKLVTKSGALFVRGSIIGCARELPAGEEKPAQLQVLDRSGMALDVVLNTPENCEKIERYLAGADAAEHAIAGSPEAAAPEPETKGKKK